MSGIAGILFRQGQPVDPAALEGMLNALAHRGPNGAGTWAAGSTGLGHRMFHTTPESLHETMPLQGYGLVLTADARIDNREELIEALRLSDRAAEIGDGEIILAAYERWGEECPGKLLGEFAFAIWDAHRQVLFCARDPFGVKPFYYYPGPELFAFASEIKGLLSLPEVPRRLNEGRLLEYLVPYFEDETHTFYAGILKLPPAHWMKVDGTAISLHRYWRLDPARELVLGSNAEYAEAFRDIFVEAVRCRLRSSGPVGSTLSGGLNTSSIACTARQLLREQGDHRLPTFSVIFDEIRQCDERTYMDAALSLGNMDSHIIHGDRIGPLLDIEDVLGSQDEPFYTPNLFLHRAMYAAAQAAGVRVFLDGLDGDTTVSHGIVRLTELARRGRWLTLFREARALARRFNGSTLGVLRAYAVAPLAPESLRQAWRAIRRRPAPANSLDVALNPDFRRRTGFDERAEDLLGTAERASLTEREDHYRRLTRGLMSFVLEVADRASASSGIEARYPFFDRRLIEFCLSLPPEQKLQDGWSRIVLRRAMEGILPPAIQWRGGKSDLGPNFEHGLLTFDREILDEVILGDSGVLEPYLEIGPLRANLEQFTRRPSWNTAAPIWKAATLALWLRQARLDW